MTLLLALSLLWALPARPCHLCTLLSTGPSGLLGPALLHSSLEFLCLDFNSDPVKLGNQKLFSAPLACHIGPASQGFGSFGAYVPYLRS